MEAIKGRSNELAQASMKLGEAMYKSQQAEAAAGAEGGEGAQAKKDEDVIDADFKEVDGDKKKGA